MNQGLSSHFYVHTSLQLVWGIPVISHWTFFVLLVFTYATRPSSRSPRLLLVVVYAGILSMSSTIFFIVAFFKSLPSFLIQFTHVLAASLGGIVRYSILNYSMGIGIGGSSRFNSPRAVENWQANGNRGSSSISLTQFPRPPTQGSKPSSTGASL